LPHLRVHPPSPSMPQGRSDSDSAPCRSPPPTTAGSSHFWAASPTCRLPDRAVPEFFTVPPERVEALYGPFARPAWLLPLLRMRVSFSLAIPKTKNGRCTCRWCSVMDRLLAAPSADDDAGGHSTTPVWTAKATVAAEGSGNKGREGVVWGTTGAAGALPPPSDPPQW